MRIFTLLPLAPALLLAAAAQAADLGEKQADMWSTAEWAVTNDSYEGNPFDVVATATFDHEASNAAHRTEMFHAGNDTWRFRFTGDREGCWTFETESDDPELDGHTGAVVVAPNEDPQVKGFLKHVGNQYAVQDQSAIDLEGYLFHVYMNQRIAHTNFEAFQHSGVLDAYLDDAQQNGFDVVFTSLNHNWFKLGVLRHDAHDSVNPDLDTFAILDNIIQEAHKRGMRWHLWAWGDEARKWTPHGLPGGVNGEVDRRLQRYIAARMGALPGWSMGYGFDLIEWTSEEGRNGWASYLHEKMGWPHLLSTRGFELKGAENNITSYSGFGGRDLTTTRGGPQGLGEVIEDIEADQQRPSLYEERHSYMREGFTLDMDGTRRLRWWLAMAGGMGGFFGFYDDSPHPYPAPEQLRTFDTFWDSRFLLGMKPAEGFSDAAALNTADKAGLVLYQQDTDSIEIDLSALSGEAPAVAVDTKQAYEEIDLEKLPAEQQTIALPHASDWAIAIGSFSEGKR